MSIHGTALWNKTFLLLLFTSFYYRRNTKTHIKDYCKINCKQRIKMPRKGEYVKFKKYENKIKSPFMIYADFDIVTPEDNVK